MLDTSKKMLILAIVLITSLAILFREQLLELWKTHPEFFMM